MQFELTPLPYELDALDPFIGPRTVDIHYHKHHGGYIKKLDAALEDDLLREKSLAEIVLASSGHVFNLAAQIWNHDFYWQSLSPKTMSITDERLQDLITKSFREFENFKTEFTAAASEEFGSGWAWLAYNIETDKLEVFSTTDAITPLTSGRKPLLTLDVWEHAYYLDYANERGKYIAEFIDHHINWDFATQNLKAALDVPGKPS